MLQGTARLDTVRFSHSLNESESQMNTDAPGHTRWQAAPYVRRAGEPNRRLASPAAILAALTLAVIACVLITRDAGSALVPNADAELQTSTDITLHGDLPGTHAWGAYGRAAAISRSAIGWLASVPSRARSLSSRGFTPARRQPQAKTAHFSPPGLGDVATTRLQQGVDLEPMSSTHPTDPIFDIYKADPLDAARIGSGYMICCIRDGHDEVTPAYTGYFKDFPHEPLCIPGYHEKSGKCEACDRNQYCPTHNDYILTCPPQLTSLPGAGHEKDCWCPPGMHGSPDAHIEGGDNEDGTFVGSCLQCPRDHFCPGEIRPKPCPPFYKVEECLQYPYSTRHTWPGAMLPCPEGSDTRGLTGMAYCECKPGYLGGKTTGGQDGEHCSILPASSPGVYSPNGTVVIQCGNHTSSAEGATSFHDCICLPGTVSTVRSLSCAGIWRLCMDVVALFDSDRHQFACVVPGYERVNGLPECLTSCVAAPGEWCGVEGEDTAYNPPSHADDAVLLVFDCPQGFYCPGGR